MPLQFQISSLGLISKVVSVLFIGVFILAAISYLRVNSEYRRNQKAPLKTQKAKLLSKRVEVKGHKNPDKDPKLNPTASIYHVVRFRLDNGELLEFDVTEEEYQSLTEGEHGRLTSQGTWFKKFDPGIAVTRGPDIASQ